MSDIGEHLEEARNIYESNFPRWSFHMCVDHVSEHIEYGDPEIVYAQMMNALNGARHQVPEPKYGLVKWSKTATKEEILALFDSAIDLDKFTMP